MFQWVKQVQNQVSDPRVIFRKGSPKRKVTDRADQVKSPDWLWGREEWYNDRPDPRGSFLPTVFLTAVAFVVRFAFSREDFNDRE